MSVPYRYRKLRNSEQDLDFTVMTLLLPNLNDILPNEKKPVELFLDV